MIALLRLAYRQLVLHPWQLVSAVFGIALGVAVVVAIDLANTSASRAFELSTEAVTGRATHSIVAGGAGLSDELYTRLRTEHGWIPAAPIVEGHGQLSVGAEQSASPRAGWSPPSEGEAEGDTWHEFALPVQILGVDPFAESAFRPSVAAELFSFEHMAGFVARDDTVALEANCARELGLAIGDSLPLLVGGRTHTVRLISVLVIEDELVARGLENVLLCDIGTAQRLLEAQGRLSRIDLLLPREREAELLAELESLLPDDADIETAASRKELVGRMTKAFRTNLQAMSLLALIVGSFLIYNTMQFSVVRRRRLIGRLRALGATRRLVFGAILIEALVLGALGTGLGLLFGALIARGLVKLVVQSINDLYFSLSVSGIALAPAVFGKALVLGILATLLAALVPALEAANTEPRWALDRSHLEGRAHGMLRRIGLFGLILAGVGVLALALPGKGLLVSYVGLFGVLIAAACFTPVVVLTTSRALARLLPRNAPIELRFALSSMEKNLSRTAVAVAALVLAVSVTVGIGIMIASFRATVDRWLGASLVSDVFVAPPASGARRVPPEIDPDLARDLQAIEGVVSSSLQRRTFVHTRCGETAVLGLTPGPRTASTFNFLSGERAAIWKQFVAGEGLLVSEPLAYRCGLAVGDDLTIRGSESERSLPVAGIFYDYATDAGTAVLHERLVLELWGDVVHSSLTLDLRPDLDVRSVVKEVRRLAAGRQQLFVWSNKTLREASLEVFDRTFAITTVLRLLAAGVAFLGVLGALFALEFDRARELSILRAVGATPGQIARMVMFETGLFGLFSGLLSLPVGGMLAWILIHVINRRSFGWTLLEASVSPRVLAEAIAIALVAALLAGLYPALRAGRVEPAAALREE